MDTTIAGVEEQPRRESDDNYAEVDEPAKKKTQLGGGDNIKKMVPCNTASFTGEKLCLCYWELRLMETLRIATFFNILWKECMTILHDRMVLS